jgi:hypothetical protein
MPRPVQFPSLVAVVAVLGVALASSAPAATSNLTVTMTVMSNTTIDATGCATSTPGVTSFGTVLPGTGVRTSADCTVRFGSSNDTSTLRIGQLDRFGAAMFEHSRGAMHATLGWRRRQRDA